MRLHSERNSRLSKIAEPHFMDDEKSASLQQSESRISTSKTASLQYSLAHVLAKQKSCASFPSESCVSTLKQVCVCNAKNRVSA